MTVPSTPDYQPTVYVDGQAPAINAADLNHNETGLDTVVNDLRTVESVLQAGLPVVYGGTGATTAAGALTNLGAQQTLTLTTTGNAGAATLTGGTLNIPQYAGGSGMTWNVRTVTADATAAAGDFIIVNASGLTITAPSPTIGAQWGITWLSGATPPTVTGTFADPITFSVTGQSYVLYSGGSTWRRLIKHAAVDLIDTPNGGYAPVASPSFTGTVTLAQDPAAALQAATKQYVDNAGATVNDLTVASDITVTNSAAAVTALSQSVGNSQTWTFDAVLHFSATTTGDIKFVISIPAGTTLTGVVSGTQIAAAGDGTLRQTAINNSNLSVGFGGIDTSGNNTGTLAAVRVAFRLTTSSSGAGTVALQFAQNTAEASSVVCKAGSWMTAARVA